MKNLVITTKGSAPSETIEVSQKQLADAINFENSGSPCLSEKRIEKMTQDFVDKHNITARYASGTFLGFNISDDACDEFRTFPR